MPMRRPLVFERERSALLAMLVEHAFEKATRRGITLSLNDQEARMILVRRLIRAIEAGETDIETLEALALRPEMIH
jgi:hypothetical protein